MSSLFSLILYTGAHVTVSSSARVYEASVQVCQCDVVYDHPSSCLTASGRLKANNKCKLQSEEQIGAGEDNCSIMAVCVRVCLCSVPEGYLSNGFSVI